MARGFGGFLLRLGSGEDVMKVLAVWQVLVLGSDQAWDEYFQKYSNTNTNTFHFNEYEYEYEYISFKSFRIRILFEKHSNTFTNTFMNTF